MRPARRKGSPLESSSSTDQPSVRAGRLGRPHGLNGFLGLYTEEEDLVYFAPGSKVHIGGRPHVVREVRRADRGYQVAFEEVEGRAGAEEIRNEDIFVAERRELGDREYWPEDLIGLEVRPGGGEVVGVSYGQAQDRLVVERDGTRFEVPFVDDLVPVVALESGFVEIVEIEGLIGPLDR